MPRPRSLTHAQIASAALAVIDRDALTGLTMRAVAGELGVSTMALYRYVADREELERLVVERVLGAVDTTPPAPELPWRERVEVLVLRLRDTVGAHPEIVPLTLTHRQGSPGVLRWSETVLGVLTGAGIEGERRVIALRGLLAYVIGAIQLEHLGPLSGRGTTVIAGLPEFPFMAETARYAAGVDADREFRGGLALLLGGMETRGPG
ncbi:TetR/AcrR family transcriptional regulator [Actinomadura sp. DC4]|uniref:TetR/AcrR family transcriptional regulator n=1 Tax=Actinomadura sp. DC4 TaxID=3055069 RepID=UPI0025B1A8D0|nr:TetR/AcrR family transcriptional regulator [Actinomadura sp. DC4]MDN3357680.1 TetR/AcrR family transcriptional regulator [Actinomadura sp. DC4]